MFANILIVIGSSIFILLGVVHMAFTFFTNKFDAYDSEVTAAMKGTSPVLTRDTTMWKAWIGFNASHSLGAIFFGAFYILLATQHAEVLEETIAFMLLALATCFFYLFLAVRYWFKIPLIGITLATVCFCIATIALRSEKNTTQSAYDFPVGDANSVAEKAEGGASVEQFANDKARTPEELSRYVGRMGNRYHYVKKYFFQADVPALIALLDDPRQCKKWLDIVEILGYIDKEEESADALIAFVRRGEDWENLPHPNRHRAMLDKANAICRLGFIGGDTITDALRILLTKAGADQFLSEWIDDTINGSGVPRSFIRGRAALGLVYTQEAANIQLVEDLYQSILPQVRVIHQRPGMVTRYGKSNTEEERHWSKLYNNLATALAMRDYIESEGMERLKLIFYNANMTNSAISTHLGKYRDDLEE